jgi:hypothetical protein
MSAWETNAREERFDSEAGTPESSEPAEPPAPPRVVVVSAVVPPGLAGVATISLASLPRESGICRCGACLALPKDIDWLE